MTTQASMSAMPKFYAELNASGRESMKKMIAGYIDTSEKMAKGVLEFQAKAASWAKETPWAPLFETQHTMACRWVEGSASLVRKLWRIQEEAMQKTEEATK